MSANFFNSSYLKAQEQFLADAKASGARLESIPIGGPELKGPQGEPLSIDVAIWGPKVGPTLILSSGLHGIEGYCGSGIQLAAMQHQFPEDLRRVFIHAINPYGMAHLRRVNENNVDLNRNFIFDPAGFEGCSDGYHKLNTLLNPPRPFQGTEPLMFIKTLWTIVKHGMPALKQAVASGQYAYPQGLFFGGHELEEGPTKLIQKLDDWLTGCGPMVHIDFHTGLGEFGDYALLLEATADSKLYREMHAAFGEKIQPWQAGEGVAYSISGGFPAAMQAQFKEQTRVLTCEFGTYPPRKVIEAMTAENRAHFFGGRVGQAKEAFKEIFYPQSEAWQNQIVSKGLFVVDQALSFLKDRARETQELR